MLVYPELLLHRPLSGLTSIIAFPFLFFLFACLFVCVFGSFAVRLAYTISFNFSYNYNINKLLMNCQGNEAGAMNDISTDIS